MSEFKVEILKHPTEEDWQWVKRLALNTVGKAAKEGYFVSIKVDGREEDKNFIHESVRYWNEKKLCFEKK